jgi:branched-chain amino acid transport system substrate-binding protein
MGAFEMRKMKLSLAAIAISAFALCTGVSLIETRAQEPLVIGIAKSSTGFMSAYDVPAALGIKLAIQDINAQGGLLGRELQWIYRDTKTDKAQAVIAAHELIDDGADVLSVSCDFDYGGPAASVAQEKGIIALGCAGSPRFGRQGVGPNAFSLDTQTPDECGSLAEWASISRGWKTVYLLTDTFIDYTKTCSQYFETRWVELEGENSIVGRDTFLLTDTSISSQVSRIRGLDTAPDVLFVPSCNPGLGVAARQIRAAGIETPIITGVCGDGDYWLESVPGLDNFYNAAYVSTYLDDPWEDVNTFVRRQIELDPEITQRAFAIIGYSEIQAYAEAVNRANSFDAAAVVEALESFTEVPLLVGPTTFTKERHGDIWRPMVIVEVKDGKHHFVERWKIQKPPPVKF